MPKRVTFSNVDVIFVFKNTPDLVRYRKRFWEFFVYDRQRFKERIMAFENLYNKCVHVNKSM
jgi:hypothetical protein